MIKENMKKVKMQSRNVLIFMFALLVSSCLKETAVPIESAFTIETSEDKTSPVTIQLKNESYTAGIKGRIGVPEFTIPRDPGVSIENGTEIWKITRDGKHTLYAVFKEGKFIVIK